MAVVALTDEHSGQIVEANEELGRVLGTPRDELLGMSGLVDFAHPDDIEDLRTGHGGPGLRASSRSCAARCASCAPTARPTGST